jgi:transglutaminase-like putative cysteine protease
VHDAHGNHRQPLLLATAVRELELSAVSLIDLHDRVDRARAADARHAETRVRAILAESGAVSAHGSCQDRATFALARLRAARHTARYVAGYRIATPTALARTQAHAWIAIELDDGWIDFDPTTGGLCREHITVSFGHGYDEVAPLGGVLFAERGVGYRQTSAVTIEPIPVAAELASAVEGVEPPSSARPAVPLTKTAASIGDRP